MNKSKNFSGQPIISQVLKLIPASIINRTAKKQMSDRYYKRFKTYDHLVTPLYYQHSFGKNFTVVLNSNVNEVWIKGTVENTTVYHKGLNANISTTPSWNLSNGYRLVGSFGYEKRRITLQQVWNDNISSYIGISKGYMENKLSVSLFAYNPFQRYRTIIEDLTGNDIQQSSTIELYYQRFNARVSYKFGKISGQVRKVKKTIYNDDVD